MGDSFIDEKLKNQEVENPSEESESKADKTVEFINEKIKLQPLNRKRLMQNMAIAILLAVMFGVIASFSYNISEHFIKTSVLSGKPKKVVITDSVSDSSVEEPADVVLENDDNSDLTLPSLQDYEHIYAELYNVAKEANKSILEVSAIAADRDWFSNEYENSNSGSGLVIANNNKELLILIDYSIVNTASNIYVKFSDGSSSEATIKKSDPNTDLAVLAVPISNINEDALSKVQMAKLGRSDGDTLLGKNVIAIGSPQGNTNSVCYGMVTSTSQLLQLDDTDVHIVATDMYGSSNGSGILINLKGQVVGIITRDFAGEDVKNLVTAYGISDIKNSIERMANGQEKAFFGIKGSDVSEIAKKEHNIPDGAYVTDIVMDSPAMRSGILSGDIITKIGTTDIKNFNDFKELMDREQPGIETVVTVARYARGSYKEITLEVVLGTLW